MEHLKRGLYAGTVAKSTHCQDDTLVACVTSYAADAFNGARHYHENAHFSFVLDGGCVETKKKDYELLPGMLTYYPAGEVHQVIRIAKPLRRINLEMDDDFFQSFELSNAYIQKRLTEYPDAKFFLVKVYQELIASDDLSIETIKMLLLQLLYPLEKFEYGNTMPFWMCQIKEYLNEHRTATISLGDLATVGGVHPVTISKNFPYYFQSTLGEYMRKLKVEKALNLLKSSSASLTKISLDCGFYDQSHFIRSFKQLTGYLPSAYQKL